jgi:hypothetical protein
MCDIFIKEDILKVFGGKSILFVGDSIMRNIYKDIVWLTAPDHRTSLTPQKCMKAKGEKKYCGDTLIKGSHLNAGRKYEEERDYYLKEVMIYLQ